MSSFEQKIRLVLESPAENTEPVYKPLARITQTFLIYVFKKEALQWTCRLEVCWGPPHPAPPQDESNPKSSSSNHSFPHISEGKGSLRGL